MKTEPSTYSWDDFVKEGSTLWDGVRNFQARNQMKEMKVGDRALFYHSVKDKEVVGVAEVIKEHYPDPTTRDDRWVVVDIKPVCPLKEPVGLAQIKADDKLSDMVLVNNSRLSVQPVKAAEFKRVLSLGKTRL
ncbi:MAG: EVE domain-containing protein [Gemmatimonadetes bacterium]|nr:EVE domain-containing protein [Gemmatimonadota bacterium]